MAAGSLLLPLPGVLLGLELHHLKSTFLWMTPGIYLVILFSLGSANTEQKEMN